MAMQTVEIAIGWNAHVLNVPLASAQAALLAELKAAGSDLNALATKAGTTIAFLQVTGARAGNALAFSMAGKTGKYTGSLLTESRRCQTRVNVLHPYTSWRGAGGSEWTSPEDRGPVETQRE